MEIYYLNLVRSEVLTPKNIDMNAILKIRRDKVKLCVSFKKQNKKYLDLKKTSTEVKVDNKKVKFNSVLSKNLMHLDFIDRLENGLNERQTKNFVLSEELNRIKRQAQFNTLSYLNNNVA